MGHYGVASFVVGWTDGTVVLRLVVTVEYSQTIRDCFGSWMAPRIVEALS